MKRNTLFLFIGITLAAMAWWFVSNRTSGTIKDELRDFAVQDTGSIVKIFMADRSGQQVTLERKENNDWILNGKHWARPDAIQTLLATISDVRVRSPVAKAAYNNIIKSIAAKGVKVELYNSKGLFKVYYVGGPDMEQTGTYMYIENSTMPFITHIPGFEGYLTPRYFTVTDEWRVKNVFKLGKGNLKSMTVIDREQGNQYTINRIDNGDYELTEQDGNKLPNVNQDKVINYLQNFRMLNYEREENTLTPEQIDSLTATVPFRSILLEERDGNSTFIEFWRRPITHKTINVALEDGTPFPYDIDRMAARLNNGDELIVVQYFSFEKLFRRPADLMNVELNR